MLPKGRVLTWADDDAVFPARNADFSKAFVVEIATGGAPATTVAAVPNRVTNLFCAGHSHLPDGRVLVLGGHEGAQYLGSADVTIFESSPQYAWRTQTNARMKRRSLVRDLDRHGKWRNRGHQRQHCEQSKER
jgi:hypothetical protein